MTVNEKQTFVLFNGNHGIYLKNNPEGNPTTIRNNRTSLFISKSSDPLHRHTHTHAHANKSFSPPILLFSLCWFHQSSKKKKHKPPNTMPPMQNSPTVTTHNNPYDNKCPTVVLSVVIPQEEYDDIPSTEPSPRGGN